MHMEVVLIQHKIINNDVQISDAEEVGQLIDLCYKGH